MGFEPTLAFRRQLQLRCPSLEGKVGYRGINDELYLFSWRSPVPGVLTMTGVASSHYFHFSMGQLEIDVFNFSPIISTSTGSVLIKPVDSGLLTPLRLSSRFSSCEEHYPEIEPERILNIFVAKVKHNSAVYLHS